jgi:hypothetical protein
LLRFSILSGPSSLDLSGSTDPTNKDGGKHLTVSVVLGGSAGQDNRIVRLISSALTRGRFYKNFRSVIVAQSELHHNLFTNCEKVILKVVTEL